MIFNQPDAPGTYPASTSQTYQRQLTASAATLATTMLTWNEKIRFGNGPIPAMIQGQKYVEAMDKYSLTEWLQKHNIPERKQRSIYGDVQVIEFYRPDEISQFC